MLLALKVTLARFLLPAPLEPQGRFNTFFGSQPKHSQMQFCTRHCQHISSRTLPAARNTKASNIQVDNDKNDRPAVPLVDLQNHLNTTENHALPLLQITQKMCPLTSARTSCLNQDGYGDRRQKHTFVQSPEHNVRACNVLCLRIP